MAINNALGISTKKIHGRQVAKQLEQRLKEDLLKAINERLKAYVAEMSGAAAGPVLSDIDQVVALFTHPTYFTLVEEKMPMRLSRINTLIMGPYYGVGMTPSDGFVLFQEHCPHDERGNYRTDERDVTIDSLFGDARRKMHLAYNGNGVYAAVLESGDSFQLLRYRNEDDGISHKKDISLTRRLFNTTLADAYHKGLLR